MRPAAARTGASARDRRPPTRSVVPSCRGLARSWAESRVRSCSGALPDLVRLWPTGRGVSSPGDRDAAVDRDGSARRPEPCGRDAGNSDLALGSAGADPISVRCMLYASARRRPPPRPDVGADHVHDRQDGNADERRPPLPQPFWRLGQRLHARRGAVGAISGVDAGDPVGNDRVFAPGSVKDRHPPSGTVTGTSKTPFVIVTLPASATPMAENVPWASRVALPACAIVMVHSEREAIP